MYKGDSIQIIKFLLTPINMRKIYGKSGLGKVRKKERNLRCVFISNLMVAKIVRLPLRDRPDWGTKQGCMNINQLQGMG